MTKKRQKKSKPAATSIVPFTDMPRRTQILLAMLGVSIIIATVYFAGAEPTIASLP